MSSDDSPWHVNVTEEAEVDLRKLFRKKRIVWQEATRLMKRLETNPMIGDSMSPPWAGARRVHFARDKYRLAWKVFEESKSVDVLAVDLKSPTFYARVLRRLGITDA